MPTGKPSPSGGQTPEGEDATNELSYLFLESKREFPMTYPDLAVRIHSRTPDRFLYEIALTVQDGSGFPKLINDEEVVPLNAIKGCPINEALDYAISGCTETRMPNRDTYTSGCVYINFATALEMLMNNGRLHYYGDELIGLETGDPTASRRGRNSTKPTRRSTSICCRRLSSSSTSSTVCARSISRLRCPPCCTTSA